MVMRLRSLAVVLVISNLIISSCTQKEVKELSKEEEKVVFTIHKFKVKKKLFFSFFLSILVAAIGFSKIDSLISIGKHITPIIMLVTAVICLGFLGLAVIRKHPKRYTKQIVTVLIILFIVFRLATLMTGYSTLDILFTSMLVTTIGVSIYDIF